MRKAIKGAAPVAPGLSPDEARKLTNEVKVHMEAMWTKLLTLYEGDAHIALGYESWGDYWAKEFGGAERRGYQLLEAGRVMKALDAHCKILQRPANDAVARELKPLLDQPEKMKVAWNEAVRRHGSRPTAKQTRKVVREQIPARPRVRVNGGPHNGNGPKRYKPLKGKLALSHDPRVVDWVRARYDEGWSRERLVAASENDTDGWPLPGEAITNGGISEVRAAIRALERIESDININNSSKRVPKKLRDALKQKKAGKLSILVDARIKILELLRETEMIDLLAYADEIGELEEQEFLDIFEEMIRFRIWMDRMSSFVQGRISEGKVREMIRHLREDNDGFEEPEVVQRKAQADRMERLLDNRLNA